MNITRAEATALLRGYSMANVIAVQRGFHAITKNINATLLLSQMFYLTSRKEEEGGWFYKTPTELAAESLLSHDQTERSITALRRMNLIESRKRGATRTDYRVNILLLAELIAAQDPVEFKEDQTRTSAGVRTRTSAGACTKSTSTKSLRAKALKGHGPKSRLVPSRDLPAVGLCFFKTSKASVNTKPGANGSLGKGAQETSTRTPAKEGTPNPPPLEARRPPLTSKQKAKWAEAVARDQIIDLYPKDDFVPTTLDRKKIRGAIMNCERRGLTREQITRQVERLAKMVETGDYRKHRVPKDPFWFFCDPEVVADQKRWGQKFFPLVQDWEFQLESWGWLSDQFTLAETSTETKTP